MTMMLEGPLTESTQRRADQRVEKYGSQAAPIVAEMIAYDLVHGARSASEDHLWDYVATERAFEYRYLSHQDGPA